MVKRYRSNEAGGMDVDADGDYVDVSDYSDLEDKVADLEDKVDEVKRERDTLLEAARQLHEALSDAANNLQKAIQS